MNLPVKWPKRFCNSLSMLEMLIITNQRLSWLKSYMLDSFKIEVFLQLGSVRSSALIQLGRM